MATTKKESEAISDATSIARGTEQIFAHRRETLVFGLTGRTGSGCSTVADEVLVKPTLRDTPWAELVHPPKTHDDRKDRIVEHWLLKHWAPFRKIQVSQVILSFTLEESSDAILALDKRRDRSQIESLAQMSEAYRDEAEQSRRILENLPGGSPEDRAKAFDYYFVKIPELSKKLRETVYGLDRGEHTKLFQQMGDNLRRSGKATDSAVDAQKLFELPKRLHLLVELGRACNKDRGINQHYFVIDAIRHPFEIHYLREKISRFFVVAISTEATTRRDRLLKKVGLSQREVIALDGKEYPREAKGDIRSNGYARFASQDMEACISAADIYLSNTEISEGARPALKGLTRSLCRYIALAQHPGLVTPTAIERCMQSAFAARLNSGCISRQVGAIVTNAEFSILAFGWNDVPRGQVPCVLRYSNDLLGGKRDSGEFSSYEKTDENFKKELSKALPPALAHEERNGLHLTHCFKTIYNQVQSEKNQVHTRSLHAEENAFLQISKHGGQGVEGGMLFTTASPCELCAKKAYQLGIETIFYIDPYPGISADHILGCGEKPPTLKLFSGVIGRAYHELYQPLMAFKDELGTLLSDDSQSPARDTQQQRDLFADRNNDVSGKGTKPHE